MARSDVNSMSYAELTKMEGQIQRLKVQKQGEERMALRQKLIDEAKKHGFDINDLFGRGKGRSRARWLRNTAILRVRRTPGQAVGACLVGWQRRPKAGRPRRRTS